MNITINANIIDITKLTDKHVVVFNMDFGELSNTTIQKYIETFKTEVIPLLQPAKVLIFDSAIDMKVYDTSEASEESIEEPEEELVSGLDEVTDIVDPEDIIKNVEESTLGDIDIDNDPKGFFKRWVD